MLENKKMIQLVVSGVLTLLFVNFYLKNKEQSISGAYDMIDVLVAARDIPPHTLLQPDYLATKKIPMKYREPGAVIVKIPDQDYRRVQGKVTQVAIPGGSQITMTLLMDPAPNTSGVAPLLPPGKRAYLLRLGNTDVGEIILPGDHIDIMATFTVRDKDATSRATYTILQNIMVISVGRELRKPNEDVSKKKEGVEALMLTLALEPTECERLSLAQAESQGDINVVIRPSGDDEIKPLQGVTPNKLLG